VGDRVELALHQTGVRPAEADAADAEGRVLLVSWFANGTGLSEPASRVRTTTFWPGNAANTSP
jgi:hypothetical protein